MDWANLPDGFFQTISRTGQRRLAFHCARCRLTYLDLPEDVEFWHCGRPEKPTKRKWWDLTRLPTVRLGSPATGAVRFLENADAAPTNQTGYDGSGAHTEDLGGVSFGDPFSASFKRR